MDFIISPFKIYYLGIEIEERVWDDVLAVFQSGCWMQMIEQWSRVVDSVTRALVLNLFEVDIASPAQSVYSLSKRFVEYSQNPFSLRRENPQTGRHCFRLLIK